MKEKYKLTRFREGDKIEHEGVTYEAAQTGYRCLCEGCAFHKYGEPCKSPKGWICSDIETRKI